MTPTIGRIVHFRLSAEQAEQVNRRREASRSGVALAADMVLRGNPIAEGSVVPLIVTAVWPNEYGPTARLSTHAEGTTYESTTGVNGQALLDGNDVLWVTSAPEHATLPGCWFWPPRS